MKLRVVASILMVLLSISAYHMVSGAVYPAKYEWILGTRPQFTPASGVATGQAVDSQGNTYVIGTYTIGILFGASSPLLTGGRPGAFVGKIKANGEFAWTQYITSTDAIVAGDGIAVTDQNVYIGGIFTDGSSATFSYDPNNVGPLTNGNTFIVKLDAATGNPVAKRTGVNNLNLNSVRLSVDGQSNVYAAGSYATEVRFGADTPLLTASNSAIYLYKFNQNLQFLTATTTQGTATSITNVDIATNSAGSSCVSATFTGGTVTLGALTPISAVGTGTGLAARFTANLSPVYLISITSPTTVGTGGIDIDSANNCYAVGQFQQSIVVGSLSGTSASGYSYYFAKLSPSGSALILTTSQGVSALQRPDVSCTTGGICYLTGALDPTSSSGGTFTFGSYTYSYNTNRGTFMVTRFNAAGAVELITSGLTTILSYGIAITAQDNTVTVTGGFRDSVQFGPLSFNIFTSSATHTFVLRFTVTDKCPLCLAPNDNCCNLAIGQGVCYNTNVHTCTSQGYLCPKGTESCGVACYDPNIYTCLDGNFLCPADHLRCGSACYNPAVHVCLTGNFLCPVDHLRCGSACYLPSQYACQNNQLFTKCVPNQCAGNRPCCPATGQCYEHVHFSCSNTGVIPKCYGIPSDSPAVCSGHGTCSTPDLCECSGGYSGALCNIAP